MTQSSATSLPSSTEGAFRALVRTLGLLKRVMEPYFARFGISGSQWSVLRTLHRAEEEGETELRLTDVGDRLLIRPPSVTGVVDRLQRLGYIDRTAAVEDHRAKHVRLTPAGRELVAQVLAQHAGQVKSVLDIFTTEEQHSLQQLLERLGAHLEAISARPGNAEIKNKANTGNGSNGSSGRDASPASAAEV
ncbi:MAG TPA: MarR family transcriptional regulator [Tepidisphaeraceae bacterium]|nr:MarR family transcriptional regulator [Tepidisphaeraceae bacterium]